MLGDSNFSKPSSTSPQHYHACRHVPHRSALSVLHLCYRRPGSCGVLLLCWANLRALASRALENRQQSVNGPAWQPADRNRPPRAAPRTCLTLTVSTPALAGDTQVTPDGETGAASRKACEL
jgi:hypothetical protein